MSDANDPRTVSELFDAAFSDDEDEAWNAIGALRWRGSLEILNRAIALTHARDPQSRVRGANILGQLGIPERTFPEEQFNAVLALLTDDDQGVMCDAIYALSHIDGDKAAPHIAAFADHKSDDIRHAVAFGLGAVHTAEAVEALVKLMKDPEADIRDWATFGVGQQSDFDSDEIIAALAAAISDGDDDVRYESIIGLGRRGDRRAVSDIIALLEQCDKDVSALEAAAKLVGWNESKQVTTTELVSALQQLQK